MSLHSITRIQKIPASPERVWDFFSSYTNLQTITPPGMKFIVLSRHKDERVYAGQLIEYRVRPILNIPLYWRTEIPEVNPPAYFVDEQRKGPFKLWRHQHFFRAIEGGVEMTDIVHYEIPLSFLGELANVLFVRRKLRRIFSYRFKKIEELFGKFK